ncbi:MAG: hypothetical protein MJ132_02360 [Clostridia bacterium]|nr:hypothetical protein [Clostridia bacterium]
MKYRALITSEMIKPMLEETLSENIEFEYAGYHLDHEVMDREELKRRIADVDILVCEYDTIDREIFDCAKNLKILLCCRGNVKSVIDLENKKKKGIIVCNNSGRNSVAVSDMTIAFMLDLTRNVTLTNNLIHNRVITTDIQTKPDEYADTVWGLDNNSPFIRFRGRSLNHMTLGLIGCGFAGQQVAKRAKSFDMDIIGYDPYIDPAKVPDSIRLVRMNEFLQKADIVSLHCVLTPQTKGMFNKKMFDAMKPGSYFINTARGELVNENDLIEALNSHHLAGAAIDVTATEPIASNCPLLDAENLIITPHIAGSAYDVQVQGTKMIVDSLTDWLEGKKPRNCVVYR